MNGVCSRCGATLADGRAILRAGASAYESARVAAMEMRWTAARKDLALAASLGIADSEEWKALDALVAAADPVVAVSETHDYEQVRAKAMRGDFSEALRLPVPKAPAAAYLHTLCRQGAQLRTQQRQRAWWNTGAVGSVCALLAVAATWSLHPGTVSADGLAGKQATPYAVISPSPEPIATPVAIASPASETPYPYPERLARRYFNDALELRRTEHYAEAARVADLAVQYGKTSYLLPDALLLRAELANILLEPKAPQLWARIAQDAPDSPYAPLGLLRAAQSTKRRTNDAQAAQKYITELLEQYPASNEARRVRNSFDASSQEATKDDAQRQ